MTSWAKVAVVLALLVLAVIHAAPVQDEKTETSENGAPTKTTETLEPAAKPEETVTDQEEEASQEAKEGAISNEEEEAETLEGSGLAASNDKEEQEDRNKEVTNYETIEADEGHDVTNDNNVASYAGSFGDDFAEYRLSEQDAVELLRELSDPAQVALFIMESDDVDGFLRSVEMLLDQGFISEGYAMFLKETVSEELDQLLMIQDEEMYEDPLDLQGADGMDTEFMDEILNQPVPYFAEDYFDNVAPYEDTNVYPEPDYEMFQQPYSEETMALAEIANIIADQIESGQMSSARGERIIAILSQLLPEGFWQDDDISDEMIEGLDEAFANLYAPMPESDAYQTFWTEDDEPLPGGGMHTEEEVVVDEEGRPVAEILKSEAKQQETFNGDEGDALGEELERELMEMGPEIPDEMEEALQDVEKLATADEETKEEDEEEQMRDELENSEWKDLVLLLDEGKLSDDFLKKLGLTSQDVLDLTGTLAADDEDTKP